MTIIVYFTLRYMKKTIQNASWSYLCYTEWF